MQPRDTASTEATDRCFIAARPDAATADALDRLAAQLHENHPGARRVPRANLHLTLAFIGPLPDILQVAIAQDLAAIDIAPFDWRIDELGAFAGARVLWAASRRTSAPLNALAAQACAALDAHGVAYDRRRFEPHVTLLRNFRQPRGTPLGVVDDPIVWTVGHMALLRSVSTAQGVRYVERTSAQGDLVTPRSST